jgi:hypothetical protein
MTPHRDLFTVSSESAAYVSPLIGNGEIVTTLGPTGYHTGCCPMDHELVNRNIFWAGRRLNTPTHALVRFGRLDRTLTINGEAAQDDTWKQTIDYDGGVVISTLEHGEVREQTRSLVCLTANVMVLNTRLENHGDRPVQLTFTLEYAFPATIDPRLWFPHMTHFDFTADRDDYPAQTDIRLRVRACPPGDHYDDFPSDETLRVLYQVGEQLGEVRVGWHPVGQIIKTENGGRLTHQIDLAPGESTDLWYWVMLSDRRKYTHFPDFARVRALLKEHGRAWGDFWEASRVTFGDAELEALRQTALYAIRCNASPWSIPPAYLATHWEGRTFHDELYPFLALISGNHPDLAARIPNFRLNVLPVALQWGGDRGARFPWESLEDGREGGPYGHWMDERFHVGQFSETAWRYYLYTRSRDDLARLYPLLRECAELFARDVLVRDEAGRLKTRLITDFDEATYPLENGIFTICAAIRSLENAAHAADILDADAAQRDRWRTLAAELRQAIPADEQEDYYRVSDDGDHTHIAQGGVVYPFAVDVHSERARNTLSRMSSELQTDLNLTAGSQDSYKGTHWMWAVGGMATGMFCQGRGNEGYELLRRAPASAGPFHSPNEHYRLKDDVSNPAGEYRVPWFTTGSGAVVYAIHAMFIQVDEAGTLLLNGWPSTLQDARFEQLMASHAIRVSGQIRDGQCVKLTAHSDRAMTWQFRIPAALVQGTAFRDAVTAQDAGEAGLLQVTCELSMGNTDLI